MRSYDVTVIGLGAMGGAAAFHCARRGARVLGLDANTPRHALGSSHGATRATRETYFESPDYVPLIRRSLDLWRELEAETGAALLSCSGAVYVGPQGHPMLAGVERAARTHAMQIERLDRRAAAARFPGFALRDGWEAIFEPRGGILRAPACQQAHLDLAARHGADLRFRCAATGWRQTNAGIVVETEQGAVLSKRVVLTPGPWAGALLADLGLPLSGRRITVAHFATARPEDYSACDMSVYFWATPEGVYAGFPHLVGEGTKIMRHDLGETCTPETVRRDVSAADLEDVCRFARTFMPGVGDTVARSLICLYTMTPDNHFVIDTHPGCDGLVFATGFSGHGFKFAPVIGEILADLALDGKTEQPIGFLSAKRFA